MTSRVKKRGGLLHFFLTDLNKLLCVFLEIILATLPALIFSRQPLAKGQAAQSAGFERYKMASVFDLQAFKILLPRQR